MIKDFSVAELTRFSVGSGSGPQVVKVTFKISFPFFMVVHYVSNTSPKFWNIFFSPDLSNTVLQWKICV